jgi:hypothetical protein
MAFTVYITLMVSKRVKSINFNAESIWNDIPFMLSQLV